MKYKIIIEKLSPLGMATIEQNVYNKKDPKSDDLLSTIMEIYWDYELEKFNEDSYIISEIQKLFPNDEVEIIIETPLIPEFAGIKLPFLNNVMN
jgi:hypothetical protein